MEDPYQGEIQSSAADSEAEASGWSAAVRPAEEILSYL